MSLVGTGEASCIYSLLSVPTQLLPYGVGSVCVVCVGFFFFFCLIDGVLSVQQVTCLNHSHLCLVSPRISSLCKFSLSHCQAFVFVCATVAPVVCMFLPCILCSVLWLLFSQFWLFVYTSRNILDAMLFEFQFLGIVFLVL